MGYRTLRRFACIGGGVEEARRELREELEPTTDAAADLAKHKAERLALATVTDAWRAAQCQVEKDNQTRAETKAMQLPTPVAPMARVAMRRAVEALPSVGRIPDREAPGPQYLAQKIEEVEQHTPVAAPLDEILSMEDNDDYQLGLALDPTGAFRVVRKKMKVPLPKNSEELRMRLRVEGYTWMSLATKFPTRAWLAGQEKVTWERYIDYVLGPTVATLPLTVNRGGVLIPTGGHPSFCLVLAYEYELRKKGV